MCTITIASRSPPIVTRFPDPRNATLYKTIALCVTYRCVEIIAPSPCRHLADEGRVDPDRLTALVGRTRACHLKVQVTPCPLTDGKAPFVPFFGQTKCAPNEAQLELSPVQ